MTRMLTQRLSSYHARSRATHKVSTLMGTTMLTRFANLHSNMMRKEHTQSVNPTHHLDESLIHASSLCAQLTYHAHR